MVQWGGGGSKKKNYSQNWQEIEGKILLGKRTYLLGWKSTLGAYLI